MRRKRVDIDLPFTFEDKGHEALLNLWWTGTLLRKVAGRFFQALGTSEAHFNLLYVLRHEKGPFTQNDLSRMLLVDKSNVTGLLDRLEKLELIRRNSVAGDRRSRHITLTGEGRKLIDRTEERYFDMVRKVVSSFSGRELRSLIRLTGKVRMALVKNGL